jgi:ferredoxin
MNELVCVVCGERFIAKRSDAMYCSEKCKHFIENENVKTKRAATDWKAILQPKKCEFCGNDFIPNKHNYAWVKYCSQKCLNRAMSKQSIESGKKKINRIRYREKHREQINKHDRDYINRETFSGNRQLALERDEFKCVMCGSEQNLHIHHKDETGIFSVGDKEKINNDLENLITLCASCHRKVHSIGKKPYGYKDISKEVIEQALKNSRTVEEAANSIGVTRKTLLLKRKQYDLPLCR